MAGYTIKLLVDLIIKHRQAAVEKAKARSTTTGTMCTVMRKLSQLSLHHIPLDDGSKKPVVWLNNLDIGESHCIDGVLTINRLEHNCFVIQDLNSSRWLTRLSKGAMPKNLHHVIAKELEVEVDSRFHLDMQRAVADARYVILRNKRA